MNVALQISKCTPRRTCTPGWEPLISINHEITYDTVMKKTPSPLPAFLKRQGEQCPILCPITKTHWFHLGTHQINSNKINKTKVGQVCRNN